MAFTDAQKAQIRRWLGYPELFRFQDVRLESAIEVVGSRPEAQAMAEEILDRLNDPETGVFAQIQSSTSNAGLKRAEEVEFYPSASGSGGMSQQMGGIVAAARLSIGQLSTLFGVPIYSDPLGGRGYAGDEFTGIAHQYGRVMRMG